MIAAAPREAARGSDGRVAAPAGHVEHTVAGQDIDRVDKAIGDGLNDRRDMREVPFDQICC